MAVTPYLFLEGKCEEAIEFYKKAVNAQVGMMMRFKEAPEGGHNPSPGTGNKIMHASLKINGSDVMMSDGMAKNQPEFKGFSLAIEVKDPAEGEKMFKALAQGGQVHQPLTETFFAKSFGMLADKFGVGWMIMAGPKNP
jgi:PhnB protein